MDYVDYIQSNEWKALCSSIKRVCVVCGSTQKIQIHHKSYKRLGHESKKDLAALCERCHMEAHDLRVTEFPYSKRASAKWNAVILLKKKKKMLHNGFPEPALNAPSAQKTILRKREKA
jgi:5-methylcytosine-specific restriction endonuclease McrA